MKSAFAEDVSSVKSYAVEGRSVVSREQSRSGISREQGRSVVSRKQGRSVVSRNSKTSQVPTDWLAQM